MSTRVQFATTAQEIHHLENVAIPHQEKVIEEVTAEASKVSTFAKVRIGLIVAGVILIAAGFAATCNPLIIAGCVFFVVGLFLCTFRSNDEYVIRQEKARLGRMETRLQALKDAEARPRIRAPRPQRAHAYVPLRNH